MSSLKGTQTSSGGAGLPSAEVGGLSRRRLLQVAGASLALASASACRWDAEEILPFQKRPAGRVPGTTRRFATALECGGVASALLATSYDGRPIKLEGNPQHPSDRGACSARSQAALLDLYDPDHSRGLVQVHQGVAYPREWREFDPYFAGVMARFRSAAGAGLAVIVEPSSSRTLEVLRGRFLDAFPKARWVEWTSIARSSELAGAKLAFGRAVRTLPRVAAARTLVTLDCDLFGEHPAALANARGFAERRDPKRQDVQRVWAIESSPTGVGGCADHRLALRAEQVLPFVIALESRVQALLGDAVPASSMAANRAPEGGFLATPGVREFLELLAAELVERRGESLLVTGRAQPAASHAVVHRLNVALGNVGRTLEYIDETEPTQTPVQALAELVDAMRAGAIECAIALGTNPIYDAPADVDFVNALSRVALSIHLGDSRDETARAMTWHLPRAHFLEAWGDASSWDGTRCTSQPLIDPIFPRRSVIEFVAGMLGETASARELVRAAVLPGGSDAQWQRVLREGFVADSAQPTCLPQLQSFDLPAVEPRALEIEPRNGALELVLAPDAKVFDGRSANNAWLQELPDAIAKTTWGNSAWIAPQTARALGVEDATLVRLKVGGRVLECVACVVPGQAPGSIRLALGYGRRAAGVVGGLEEDGVETVGFDSYRLRTRDALEGSTGLAVEPTGQEWPLARTTDPAVQDGIGKHGIEERMEELLRETPLAQLLSGHSAHDDASSHHPPLESLWEHAEPGDVRWGMVIDLNACVGCNACTIACQAENNVPVVGREQVLRGREMHWIRIDRYFREEHGATSLRFQPLTCQHCESAPCEQVCPVAATVHSADGLNDMVYNRCIGTRYCANNCPFKVRRFNFFNYHKDVERDDAQVMRMRFNPEVTVRHRGVMEKCTFCVQRIQAAKIEAKNAGRALVDGEVVSACAQTCPTRAIVFGDLANPNSLVARLAADGRAYRMLEELNIRPRTSYLAKVTNLHPSVGSDER